MNYTSANSEMIALINLIDDPDESVYSHVKNKIEAHGELIIPQLEMWWESHNYGPLFQRRVEELIQTIQYQGVYQRLRKWKLDPQNDLLEGVLLINRYQYPGFDEDELKRNISKLRQDIWLELNDNLTALETVRVFNHILFRLHGFSGNREDYHSPQNSYFTDLLSGKTGNPLSLGILYRILGASLDIPVYGVNLPSHFVLCYALTDTIGEDGEEIKDNGVIKQDDILFYINPFSEGAILHKDEVEDFVRKAGIQAEPAYFLPCTNNDMICRMLNNLIFAYQQQKKEDKVRELKTLVSIFLES